MLDGASDGSFRLRMATTLIFEGIPTWPNAGRFWKMIERHKVNTFYNLEFLRG